MIRFFLFRKLTSRGESLSLSKGPNIADGGPAGRRCRRHPSVSPVVSTATPPDLHPQRARTPAGVPARQLPKSPRARRKPPAPALRAHRLRSSSQDFRLKGLSAHSVEGCACRVRQLATWGISKSTQASSKASRGRWGRKVTGWRGAITRGIVAVTKSLALPQPQRGPENQGFALSGTDGARQRRGLPQPRARPWLGGPKAHQALKERPKRWATSPLFRAGERCGDQGMLSGSALSLPLQGSTTFCAGENPGRCPGRCRGRAPRAEAPPWASPSALGQSEALNLQLVPNE